MYFGSIKMVLLKGVLAIDFVTFPIVYLKIIQVSRDPSNKKWSK